MPSTLYLIDGHALAYRTYFALTSGGTASDRWLTSDGEPTAGVYGFTSVLLRLLEQERPDYLAVVFDTGKTFRDELFPDYKATREKMPDDLRVQIERIRNLVDTFNIPRAEMEGYEADDVLGSLANWAVDKGLAVKIITGDKDLLQLVNDRISVSLPGKTLSDARDYFRDDVKESMGVWPEQVVDFKAIIGDRSDNIPGVYGVGKKTAVKLLEEYKTLDQIYNNLEAVPSRFQTKLAEGRESALFGEAVSPLEGLPISGILGDQQAALFGQTCFDPGDAKNTYGTGCFLLLNSGSNPTISKHGLLTTLAYKIGAQEPVYALEGSIAIAGALIQWLRDNLGLIQDSSEVEKLAREVDNNGGIYFVPAFSGLYAPYWQSDARGVIAGLTSYINKAHIARAALEATAFQTKEILEAMEKDTGINLKSLKVDGGMVGNELLMQFQADLLNVPVIRPTITETTALGAAYAAGLAVGFWKDLDSLRTYWKEDHTWVPDMSDQDRLTQYNLWKKAVSKSFNWLSD